ncbi:SMP-30/gluconolactonase/LRE family protein [Aeromicrobium sp.]|uniref:SMP-30/gluconolactonase/LRE family protein n=1 Tax=Aeromicrobium sp. TaxID=1871063 RepID=UPI0019BDF8C2|nr:SMP-30/gluconolactonase/LRE family protein [Aeromicrobium sp.]MBC7632614.1 SMP-30/gluconolactonase/LRE family protein [Aeromicrobium sp.]
MTAVVQVTDPIYPLAEGPLWDAAHGRVIWVDIMKGLVLEGMLEGDRLTVVAEHRFDGYVGAVACAENGSLLVAETRGLTLLAPDGTRTAGPELICQDLIPPERPSRFNDGVCDAAGRFLVGTLSLTTLSLTTQSLQARPTAVPREERLWQVGPEGATIIDDDLGLSNGLAFSPDGSLFYSVDSIPGTVWVRDYDQTTGHTGERRVFLPAGDGTPDGLAVDAAGRLWIAIWDRAEIRCHSPAGDLLETIDVPAPHPTSVAFVGPDLDQLLITTEQHAADAHDDAVIGRELSGSLFLCRPGVVGLAPHLWSGHPSPPPTTPGEQS